MTFIDDIHEQSLLNAAAAIRTLQIYLATIAPVNDRELCHRLEADLYALGIDIDLIFDPQDEQLNYPLVSE